MATPLGTDRVDGFDATELAARRVQRRAVEAAIWGMPLVSVDAMRQAFLRDAGACYGDVVFWARQADWRLQIATPSAAPFNVYIPFDTHDGAIVLDLPPANGAGIIGSLNDAWQVPAVDVGPTGEDRGEGARYLVLPPEHHGNAPAGYIPVRFPTYNGYALLRVVPTSAGLGDLTRALDLVKRMRVYPLALAATPPPQRHLDAASQLFDGLAHFDETFFESLARMVSEEPPLPRDAALLGQLRALGIERGKPFAPDATTTETLRRAAREARAGFVQATRDLPSHWPDTRWALPGSRVGLDTAFRFECDGCLDADARGQLFFLGCAPPLRPGVASFHLLASKDRDGEPLQPSTTYRLHVPANVPARQFWAVSVYSLETAAFVREAARVELGSYDAHVVHERDGSVDLSFSPAAPSGAETNWIPTPADAPWIVMFHCYGPGPTLLDGTWRLPDVERLRA